MNKCKRIYAMLLAVMLILTMLPTAVFARETGNSTDVLIYNCGSKEVTIGSGETVDSADQDSGDSSNEALDATFDADGGYTIQLEENAFFPYDIQFQSGGKTTVETFSTPDSTVTVGGHQIRVASSYSEDAISQIGFYIDGAYVPVTPEAKEFRKTARGERSLLPLKNINVNLDLTKFTPDQLKAVDVSAIVDGINAGTDPDAISNGKSVLWDHTFMPDGTLAPDETFRPIGTAPVNMATGSNRIEMLVGTENQLDAANLRYIIKVNRLNSPKYRVELYAESPRTAIPSNYTTQTVNGVTTYKFKLKNKYPVDAEYLLNIKKSSSSQSGYHVRVFSGHFDTAEAAEAASGADITDKIYEQQMNQPGAGYKANYSTAQSFTIVTKLGDQLVALNKISVQTKADDYQGLEFDGLYDQNETSVENEYDYAYDEATDVETITVTLSPGYFSDNAYYLNLLYYSEGEENTDKITKAVVGHYDRLEDAANQADIKRALFPENNAESSAGYLANFKDGIHFTVFAEGEVYKETVQVLENTGSNNTYLDIYGAEGISSVYKVQSKDDSGTQQFGYQILLVDDKNVDLSALKPIFSTMNDQIRAFVGGVEQVSGETVQDFSAAPVQYTARAANNKDIQNYWVSFIKKVAGAKLYVVVDGEKPGEREVFFDNYTDNHHDIFLSNIGDAALTGLNVELKDAQNVTLDGYWKVGGTGNETLAAFDSTTKNYSNEMSNIAKIRLLPTGEGDVSGTLVISSANGGSYTIDLKGYAGNPTIITPAVKEAVKYVPYSFLIQTNNKYQWNKVTFLLDEGELPNGMVLRPSGELYGVPTETGSFTFTVCAEYSDYNFSESTKEFTLTVLENTNENVANQVDMGYEILDFIPSNITGTQNHVFRSKGSFGEFIDFWIDGKKLVRDVDYKANEGSTAVTVTSQTFQSFGEGTHTVAAEFRTDGDTDKDMKRAAQNYTLNFGGGTGGNNNNNGGNGSGGGSGSGSGGGSGTSGNRGTGSVNPIAVAEQAAKAAAAQSQLVVGLNNVDLVTLAQLKEIAAIAQKAGKTPWLNVDTLSADRKSVDVRIGINPALARTDLYLAGSTTSKQAVTIKALFEKFFSNPIVAAISLSQKKDFGQTAEICVKVPQDVKAADLVLYSYDAVTNQYQRIENPGCWIDINGYLHFNTFLANNIIVSVGTLKN